MQVSSIMQKDIVSVQPTDSVQKAAKKMRDSHVGMLLVLEEGRVKGIVTDKEITKAMGGISDVEPMRADNIMNAGDDDGNRCCYFNEVQVELLTGVRS